MIEKEIEFLQNKILLENKTVGGNARYTKQMDILLVKEGSLRSHTV